MINKYSNQSRPGTNAYIPDNNKKEALSNGSLHNIYDTSCNIKENSDHCKTKGGIDDETTVNIVYEQMILFYRSNDYKNSIIEQRDQQLPQQKIQTYMHRTIGKKLPILPRVPTHKFSQIPRISLETLAGESITTTTAITTTAKTTEMISTNKKNHTIEKSGSSPKMLNLLENKTDNKTKI